MNQGLIVAIKRFEIHDGDGIRSTLFLKGCPLSCLWCHNPEAISTQPQLAYNAGRCIGCLECVRVCPVQAHQSIAGKHELDRSRCIACGRCAPVCLSGALNFYGQLVSPNEVLARLLEDRIFYEASGGGVTLSGGEPLAQADFCADLLGLLKRENIHTAVDTCGYAPKSELRKILDVTDLFLYDLKCLDESKHIRLTGQSNRIILSNLCDLVDSNRAIEIRIPLIPGYQDDQIGPISRFLRQIGFTGKVKVLPYHRYATAKYEALGMNNTMPAVPAPDRAEIDNALQILRSDGLQAESGLD